MSRYRLIWQFFPAFLLVALAALLAVTLFSTQTVRSHLMGQFEEDLKARAVLLASRFAEPIRRGDDAAVDALCALLGETTQANIHVLAADERLLGSSLTREPRPERLSQLPEVAAALADQPLFVQRRNDLSGETLMYTALAIKDDGETLGVVQVGQSLAAIEAAVRTIYLRLLIGGAIVTVGVALVSWRVAHRLIDPIEKMKRGAIRFASGDLGQPMPLPESQEMAELAEAMNRMARQLDERIRTAVEQRNEREAILSSMVEGVVAVDAEQRIITMNRAASALFGVHAAAVEGKNIQHAFRNAQVLELIRETIAHATPLNREIRVSNGARDMALQVHSVSLRDASGQVIGALLVFDDVSDLRRLERVRSDFVANVSHELRTPITSIKGFVETLLDGALDEPADARRFLEIVARQADRLNAIIEDLLTLSRLEQDESMAEGILAQGALLPVLQSAVQLCANGAEAKGIALAMECPPTLKARISAALLEQGVTNLIDNAVKYSEPGSEVRVKAAAVEGQVVVSVQDQGCGIPAEHLPRLFERFYRVDKARSREVGGTGLGLAIVKHIAQAHAGRVEVESKPGSGSVFRIILPGPDPIRDQLQLVI
ncbi:MAG: hypothetical protein RLZZ303_3770 [Candidatus Hydrogenedentota bacterium]